MLTSARSSRNRSVAGDLRDRQRIVGPRGSADFNFEVVVVVDLKLEILRLLNLDGIESFLISIVVVTDLKLNILRLLYFYFYLNHKLS